MQSTQHPQCQMVPVISKHGSALDLCLHFMINTFLFVGDKAVPLRPPQTLKRGILVYFMGQRHLEGQRDS
jgi:hypothetical protein